MITATRVSDEEFMRLPDNGRKHELVAGEIREVAAGVRHDILGANIIALLKPFTRGHGFLCSSQAGFRMMNRNIRCPDVSFIRKDRFPQGIPPTGFGDFAPDLCLEIISPSEDRSEMERKVQEAFASCAEEVWHLFPESQRVTVYTSPTEFKTYEAEDEIDGGDILPGFRCIASDLFTLD